MDELTAWEFIAAIEGWKSANCPEDDTPTAPTDEEHDALVAKYG